MISGHPEEKKWRLWRRWDVDLDLQEHEDKILLLLSLVVSAIVGLTIVAFVVSTEKLGSILVSAGGSQRFLSPLFGSLVGGWLLYRFFPEARGSGIPQTRVALVLRKGVIGLRTVVGKFICSSISLGSGVALGREGPSVHIGAGIASVAGRRLGLSEENVKSLIPVGTAAAVAAAFNTPLAAVLFTLEEILADLHARVVGSVVIGAATSWIVLRMILGDEPLFHVPQYQLVHPGEFLIYALLGVAGAIVSTAFVKLLLWQRAAFLRVPLQWKPFAPAAGGLTVGLLALLAPGVIGVGYHLVGDALNGQMPLRMMMLLLALKILATATSYSSGNAGGIFGPSLFIGAMLGGAVGHAAHSIFPDHTGNAGAYALVGMGAAFAGIIRTPMTSVIMIFEVTRDYTIIVPLMISNLCSYFLAQKLQRMTIYEALSLQDGITMPSAAHRSEPLTVEAAMRPASNPGPATPPEGSHCVYPDEPLDWALQRMGKDGIKEIFVISRAGGGLIGQLDSADALQAYHSLSLPSQQNPPKPVASQDWLPILAMITAAAVLVVSGLVFWQRSHRAELGTGAYRNGRELISQGRIDEAIFAFRTGLAHTPQNSGLRAALGLALVQSGHYNEALSYLTQASRADPDSGPILMGLAEVALAQNRKEQALQEMGRALAKEWKTEQEPQRRAAQFRLAELLAQTGRRGEAASLLRAIIEQRGDDPVAGRKAATMVKTLGSSEQAEEAYSMLAKQFPADAGVWMSLGDVRFEADRERPALDAYRQAAAVDPENDRAREAIALAEEVLRLDPTRRGLPVRERARRWDIILQRVWDATSTCRQKPEELDRARPLLKQPARSLESADKKTEAALRLWQGADQSCRSNAVLEHILSKLKE